MARKPRIEYAGAVYHVMNRGNHQQAIFRQDEDRTCFLKTLGEVCERTGWRVHSYILMRNHYHLLLETPEPNLVAGMQWFQGTYTKRFNAAHREWGHLFQGRYKAIPIEPGGEYFMTVSTYIHLNPVRMKGYNFKKCRLSEYMWSSYPGYIQKRSRMPWLYVGRVLSNLGLQDTPSGRKRFASHMTKRILEVQHADKPREADERWQRIRRGWYLGGDDFRMQIIDRIESVVAKDRGTAFGGESIQYHHEGQATKLLEAGLKALQLNETDLFHMPKSSPKKCALAWLIRKNTSVKVEWIKDHLCMGKATNFSALLKELEKSRPGMEGYGELKVIRSINI